MRRYTLLALIVVVSLWVAVAIGKQDAVFKLRLVPLSQGIWEDQRGIEPEIITKARKLGIDLQNPIHPLLVHSYRGGRLFYLFYKTVENASGPQHYLIQRIRKEERFYSSATDWNPKIRVTYLVEAFKLRDGALKEADQHVGSYGISSYYKREIIKEYEIGFGQIDNIASGAEWPFKRNILYKEIQDYNPDRTLYNQVRFQQSKKWTLSVAFNQVGWYSIRSPEFGFDAPNILPRVQEARLKPAKSEATSAQGGCLQGYMSCLPDHSPRWIIQALTERYWALLPVDYHKRGNSSGCTRYSQGYSRS